MMPEKPLEYAANLLKRGTEMAKQQARAITLQTQILRLRGEKDRLLLRMGQKVYALFEQDLVKNADLLTLCREAGELEREIAERETEIEQLRAGHEEPEAAGTASATESAPVPEGTDLGDSFLRSGMPPTPAPPAWNLPPAAETSEAEASPGSDPIAEPHFLAEIAPAPVGPRPDGDPTEEPSVPSEPPASEPDAGSDPTAEPAAPPDLSGQPSRPASA